MKEIIILIQQLRNYPNNFFVHPEVMWLPDGEGSITTKSVEGLAICDMEGNQQGFIETGGKGEVVIQ